MCVLCVLVHVRVSMVLSWCCTSIIKYIFEVHLNTYLGSVFVLYTCTNLSLLLKAEVLFSVNIFVPMYISVHSLWSCPVLLKATRRWIRNHCTKQEIFVR